MPAITSTKTLSANAQALPRAYPTSHMISLCVLRSQPQHCTCQVMRRMHRRALLKRSSNCVVRQLGPGPGSRTAACHTSDPSAAPPHFPYFDWLQGYLCLYEWRRTFDPHVLQGCMDLIMPKSFGGGALEEESISRSHLTYSTHFPNRPEGKISSKFLIVILPVRRDHLSRFLIA